MSGWYHVVDAKQNPQGQIKVRIAPPTVAKRSWRALQHDSSPRRPITKGVGDANRPPRSAVAARGDLEKLMHDLDDCTRRLYEHRTNKVGTELATSVARGDGSDDSASTAVKMTTKTPPDSVSDGTQSAPSDSAAGDLPSAQNNVDLAVREAREFLARISSKSESGDGDLSTNFAHTTSSTQSIVDDAVTWPRRANGNDPSSPRVTFENNLSGHESDLEATPESVSGWTAQPQAAREPRGVRQIPKEFDVDDFFSTTDDTGDDIAQDLMNEIYTGKQEQPPTISDEPDLTTLSGQPQVPAEPHEPVRTMQAPSDQSELQQLHTTPVMSPPEASARSLPHSERRPETAPSGTASAQLSFGDDHLIAAGPAAAGGEVQWHSAPAPAHAPTVHETYSGFQDMKAAVQDVREELRRANERITQGGLGHREHMPRSALLDGGLDLPGPSDAETSRLHSVFSRFQSPGLSQSAHS